MFDLINWAARWNVPPAALADLRRQLGTLPSGLPPALSGRSEAAVQNNARLEAANLWGTHLWRNQVGALPDQTGRYVRFGLCNDTPAINEVLKSSDCIGLKPVWITPEMVGQVIGQFAAVEMKEVGWQYTGTEHEKAQLAYGELVIAAGGSFRFYNGEGPLWP